MKDIKTLKSIVKFIDNLIATTQKRGSLIAKYNKDKEVYGFVFRNVDWLKLGLSLPKLQADLKDVPWNLSVHLARKDDPSSTEVGKDNSPLKDSYCYLGKDFRDIPDVDTILDNEFAM
jgi:hypothetical protein